MVFDYRLAVATGRRERLACLSIAQLAGLMTIAAAVGDQPAGHRPGAGERRRRRAQLPLVARKTDAPGAAPQYEFGVGDTALQGALIQTLHDGFQVVAGSRGADRQGLSGL